jgi:25S rRNA (adenine2142-N1)-methyltransferase
VAVKPASKIGKKHQATANLIRRFHTIRKQLAGCNDDASRKALERELKELGGLDAYQRASLMGQSTERGGDSSKWLLPRLKAHASNLAGVTSGDSSKDVARPDISLAPKPLQLLDVGALRNNYRLHSWI